MISKKILSTFLFVTAVMALPLTAAEEMRGILITGSDWAAEEGKTGKARKITQIITAAADKGFNAVFFEVRSAAGCFYPYGDGTWSTLLNEEDPGFDPLQHAIDEAKHQGMQFHAQMNLLQLDDPEMSLHHKTRKEWILRDADRQPLSDEEHYYLDPSSPEVITYLKSQVRAVTAGYAVDGLHFTGIRYPGPGLFGIPSFQNQYNATKAFTGLMAEEFAQQLLTSCLEALLTEARLMKPYLVFSAETEPLPYDMRGYGDLRPADTHYFQNGLEWLKTGLIDILVPRMHMSFRDRKALFNEYLRNIDVAHRIVPAIYGGEENIRVAGIKRFVDHIRHKAGSGALIGYASAAASEDSFYEGPAACPHLAYTHANTQAVEIDLSAFPVPHDIIRVDGNDRCRIVDRDRKLSLSLPDLPRYLSIRSMDRRMRYNTRGWTVPYRYTAVSEKALERPEMFIELRRAPDHISQDSSFSFLFRASEGETRINDSLIEPYSHTRVFFSEIAFAPCGGGTRVRGSVEHEDMYLFYEDLFFGNYPDTSSRHAVLTGSVSPQGTVILPPDDVLRITFSSDLAEEMDTILLYANNMSFPVWYNGARYVAELPCRLFEDADSAAVRVAARDTSGNKYSRVLPVGLKVRPEHSFPLIETKGDFTPVSYSRGLVRLGGPYLNEFPKGVRFSSNGKFGDVYRVKLNATEQAFIDERYVRECPPGMPRPAYNITSMSIAPDTNADRVVIPWPEPVPYAVFPEPELQRIRIRLYGVRSNSTWISHRRGLKMIDHVSWEQKDAGTYDVLVYLKDSNIWGYDLKQTKRSLVLGVKYPPEKQELVIALEAGHGGEWNWGAVGLSGLKEKDINLDVTERLRDRLKEMGYSVVEIRPGDSSPTLRERWLLTDSLQADLFVSVHANAAGGGYLRVGGTSTYYKDPFWKDFAEIAYDKLLELPLEEFGRVGSFNYMMCRMPQRPSILVEQAFMSHAEDENKLADPEFRTRMAEKIAEAVNAYIERKLGE